MVFFRTLALAAVLQPLFIGVSFCAERSALASLDPKNTATDIIVPQSFDPDRADDQYKWSPYPDLPPNGKVSGLGISHSGDPYDIPDYSHADIARLIKKYGGKYYRPHIPLKEALPVISAQQVEQLKLAAQDPSVLEAMTDELARNGSWARIDAMVDTFYSHGIQLAAVAGCGYKKEIPALTRPDGKTVPATPSLLGPDVYVTMLKWYVGAAARRYAAKVPVWQVENEINTVATHVLGGWRIKDSAWSNYDYCIKVLRELSATVHAEGEKQGLELKTTQNFATNRSSWTKYVKDSAPFLDIIGLDMYANYVLGWPSADEKMANLVIEAKQAGGGKPVWILEAGYARAPAVKRFTPKNQAEYFKRLIDRSFRNGADVILVFGWFWNPAGWYTDSGKPAPWYSIMAAEPYWSPTYKDKKTGSTVFGPAWDEFQKAAGKWSR